MSEYHKLLGEVVDKRAKRLRNALDGNEKAQALRTLETEFLEAMKVQCLMAAAPAGPAPAPAQEITPTPDTPRKGKKKK